VAEVSVVLRNRWSIPSPLILGGAGYPDAPGVAEMPFSDKGSLKGADGTEGYYLLAASLDGIARPLGGRE
jgi:hypothetical protein